MDCKFTFFKGWFAQDNQNSSTHNLITFNNFIGTQFIHVPKSSKAKKTMRATQEVLKVEDILFAQWSRDNLIVLFLETREILEEIHGILLLGCYV